MPTLSQLSWLLIFTLFALPLIFSPFSYLAFELPKAFLLYLFSAFAAYLLLISGYRLGKFSKVHYLYFILLIWIIFTAILGLSFQQSLVGSYFRMQGLIMWACYGLLFFISGKLFEDNYFKKYASLALLVSSSTVATIAIIQFISLWFFGNTLQLLYSHRVISTFGQPNFLGAYLVMSLPFIWFFKKQLTKKWQALTYVLMIIVVMGIFSTFSRSAYLGLAVLGIIWGFYHYRLLLVAIISSIIVFALLANLFPNLVYQQWYRFKLDTVARWTAENRLQITQKSFQLAIKRPIVGYGLENFSLAFPSVVSKQDLGLKDIVVDSSHNLFLDLSAQIGFVGLAIYILFLISALLAAFQKLKLQSLIQKDFDQAAICTIIAFLIIHQFSPYSVVPMMLFWFCLGIIAKPAMHYFALSRITKYIFRLIGISLIALTILFTVQTIRAEAFFRQSSAYEVSDIYKAIDLDNQAIQLAPWNSFYQARRNFLLKQLGY